MKRKKIFPKPPVRFHSKLEPQLGRNSNKTGYEASVKAIYYSDASKNTLTERQAKQLESLKRTLRSKL